MPPYCNDCGTHHEGSCIDFREKLRSQGKIGFCTTAKAVECKYQNDADVVAAVHAVMQENPIGEHAYALIMNIMNEYVVYAHNHPHDIKISHLKKASDGELIVMVQNIMREMEARL